MAILSLIDVARNDATGTLTIGSNLLYNPSNHYIYITGPQLIN